MPSTEPGAQVGGYRLESVAGRGGMGVVYRATQTGLGRTVALKLIAPQLASDPDFRGRFVRESRLAASIDHPNVIPVYEAGEEDGLLYLAMRYVDGIDLGEIIHDSPGGLDPPRAVRLVAQIAAALDAAHRRGLVHRDVKPANALVTRDDGEHVYLTDFGLTKHQSEGTKLTRTGLFVGTVAYISPEQVQGAPATAASDIYALGCVLWHALTGAAPYTRDTDVATLFAHVNEPVPVLSASRSGLPAALDDVLARALAKDPAERYATAGDFARAAAAAVAGGDTVVPGGASGNGAGAGEATVVPGAATGPGAHTDATASRSTAAAGTHGPTDHSAPAANVTVPGATGRPAGGTPTVTATRAASRLPYRPARVAASAFVALAVVGGVLALTGVLGGDDAPESAPAGARSGASATAAVAAPAATIDVGDRPEGLGVDGNTVYVVNVGDSTLARIDARTNAVVGTPIDVGGNPDSVAVGKGVVWTTSTSENYVRRIDAGGSVPVPGRRIPVGTAPEGVAIGRQLVWVVNSGDNTAQRIDRATPTLVGGPIAAGRKPVGVFVGTSVWIANSGDGTVTRIDPGTTQLIGEPIPVGDDPRSVVEGAGSTWVANTGDGTVTRIDAKTGEVVGDPIPVGAAPRELALGFGSVWVANSADNTVTRIDAGTGRVVGSPIPVGSAPAGIAVGAGAVWVSSSGDDTVTRIDPG